MTCYKIELTMGMRVQNLLLSLVRVSDVAFLEAWIVSIEKSVLQKQQQQKKIKIKKKIKKIIELREYALFCYAKWGENWIIYDAKSPESILGWETKQIKAQASRFCSTAWRWKGDWSKYVGTSKDAPPPTASFLEKSFLSANSVISSRISRLKIVTTIVIQYVCLKIVLEADSWLSTQVCT